MLLAGDAAGVVAPASGEGIYYAMTSGRLAAEAVDQFVATGDRRALATARKRFMTHGTVFWILGVMQKFWYSNDRRRERFVTIRADRDVQKLTWDSYMNKELNRAKPLAHAGPGPPLGPGFDMIRASQGRRALGDGRRRSAPARGSVRPWRSSF